MKTKIWLSVAIAPVIGLAAGAFWLSEIIFKAAYGDKLAQGFSQGFHESLKGALLR